MKNGSRWIMQILSAAFLCAGSAQAATFYFDNSEGNGLWNVVDNWHNQWDPVQTNTLGIFPNSPADEAYIAQTNGSIFVSSTNIAMMTTDITVQRVGASWGIGNGGNGLGKIDGGGNTLTLQGSGDNNYFGCFAGVAGGTFLIDNVNLVITNPAGNQLTWLENRNSSNNATIIGTNATLTLHTVLGVNTQGGGILEINCPLLASEADLIIQANNLSFNAGHDSSAFGRDMVFQGADKKLTVNGGRVLAPFRKFQVNGDNAELELNGAYAVNGPDIVVGGANNFLIDANSDQSMGTITLGSGSVTIDLDPAVTELAFSDSSAQVWSGPVVISNFVSEVVRFGTTSGGLSATQLGLAIAYDAEGFLVPDLNIDADGFLTGTTAPLRFTELSLSGADLSLTWDSIGGRIYRLLASETLEATPDAWAVAQSDIAATPPTNTLTIPFPAQAQTFFAVDALPAPPLFFDDFEQGPGAWTHGSDGAEGTIWEWGAPSNVGPATGANGSTNCFGTNLSGDYTADANVWLRSPTIDLTAVSSATLRFAHFIDTELTWDSGSIRVLDATNQSELGVVATALDGVATDWASFRAPLPEAAIGQLIQLEFRLVSDSVVHFSGWYIDDVQVSEP